MKNIKAVWIGAGAGLAVFAAIAGAGWVIIWALETLRPVIGIWGAFIVVYAAVAATFGAWVGLSNERGGAKCATSDTSAQLHVEGR